MYFFNKRGKTTLETNRIKILYYYSNTWSVPEHALTWIQKEGGQAMTFSHQLTSWRGEEVQWLLKGDSYPYSYANPVCI